MRYVWTGRAGEDLSRMTSGASHRLTLTGGMLHVMADNENTETAPEQAQEGQTTEFVDPNAGYNVTIEGVRPPEVEPSNVNSDPNSDEFKASQAQAALPHNPTVEGTDPKAKGPGDRTLLPVEQPSNPSDLPGVLTEDGLPDTMKPPSNPNQF